MSEVEVEKVGLCPRVVSDNFPVSNSGQSRCGIQAIVNFKHMAWQGHVGDLLSSIDL